MKFRPCADRVLVFPEAEADKTPGGIVLPDSAKVMPMRGCVVAVGPGKRADGDVASIRVPVDLEVGQTVYYPTHAGIELTLDGKKYRVLSEDELLGIEE